LSISGSTKALMECRFKEARFGATRFSYATPTPFVFINDVDNTAYIDVDSIKWLEQLDDRVDKVTFRMRYNASATSPEMSGATVDEPKVVKLAIGDSKRIVFAGPIQKVNVKNQHPGQDASGKVWEVEANDYGRDLRRMLVIKPYHSQSASDIALDLLTAGASPQVWPTDDANRPFTGNHIQAGLPTVDEITFKYASADKALQRLAERINAFWYVDQDADLHFFTTDEGLYSAKDLDADDAGYWNLEMSQDDKPTITQVLVEGKGSPLASTSASGVNTTLTVEDGDVFDSAGGIGVIGADQFAYTGKASANVLNGVTWIFTATPAKYEKGEYVGQVFSAVLAGAATSDYQLTVKFHRDRRMTKTEAPEFASTFTQNQSISARYMTRDQNARVGAAVTINRTTSHLTTSFTDGIITKQETRWLSSTLFERSVEVKQRTRTRLKSFFDNQDQGIRD